MVVLVEELVSIDVDPAVWKVVGSTPILTESSNRDLILRTARREIRGTAITFPKLCLLIETSVMSENNVVTLIRTVKTRISDILIPSAYTTGDYLR